MSGAPSGCIVQLRHDIAGVCCLQSTDEERWIPSDFTGAFTFFRFNVQLRLDQGCYQDHSCVKTKRANVTFQEFDNTRHIVFMRCVDWMMLTLRFQVAQINSTNFFAFGLSRPCASWHCLCLTIARKDSAEQAIASRKDSELTQSQIPNPVWNQAAATRKVRQPKGHLWKELHQSHNRTDGEVSWNIINHLLGLLYSIFVVKWRSKSSRCFLSEESSLNAQWTSVERIQERFHCGLLGQTRLRCWRPSQSQVAKHSQTMSNIKHFSMLVFL